MGFALAAVDSGVGLRAEDGQTLRCRVLVLTGAEADQWSFLTAADRDRRLAAMADVEHHSVSGAGHYVHVERPDAVVEHMARFFN